MFDAEHDTADQQIHCIMEIFACHRFERTARACAGIVEQAIEPAEPLGGGVDRAFDVSFNAHVALNETRRSTDAFGDGAAGVLIAPGEDDFRTFFDEQLDRCLADAAGAARNDRDLAVEPVPHRYPFV